MNDQEYLQLRDEFVRPFYLSLLHGNFTFKITDDSTELGTRIVDAAKSISDTQLLRLLREREWRGRLTASWFVGLTSRSVFIEEIGQLLIGSEMVYAGQGYCLALGLIGGQTCRGLLSDYLREYLPLRGRIYDQLWAIGALCYLQPSPPEEFLDPQLWTEGTQQLDPAAGILEFAELVGYLKQNRFIA